MRLIEGHNLLKMHRKSELHKSGIGEHWRRQIGDVHPSAFARQIGGCEDLVRRLVKYAELDGHGGCVNTVSFNPSGELLVSGSDDMTIKVWNWASKEEELAYDSGHQGNVFQARVMPYSDDRVIVSCAADGQVRSGTILQDGTVSTKKLANHRGRVHKLALESGSSRIFYSCGEDGVVQHFDLREEKSTKLLTCRFRTFNGRVKRSRIVKLNAIVMNPINLNYFAVGGSDQYARVYDIRRVKTNGSGMEDQPIECYAPKHLQEPGRGEHITCVAYSHQGELLASYNDELIYLFDKSMSLGSSPPLRHEEENDSLKEEGKEQEEEDAAVAFHQQAPAPQVYEGHRNHDTVKGVNFFGPNSEYVISGSDCGQIYIWRKKGGKLVAMMRGDKSVVNCLEPHPHATILATSGLDDSVKVWAPVSPHLLDLPSNAERIMRINKRRREGHAFNISHTPPDLVRTLLLSRDWQAPSDEEGGTYTRVSFEGAFFEGDEEEEAASNEGSEEEEEEEDSDDGAVGNPRECLIS